MSIRVAMADLAPHIVRRGGGFLLSSIMDSRPHAAHLMFDVATEGDQVEVRARVGRTSYANCRQRSSVTVLWPSPLAVPAGPEADRSAGGSGDSGADADAGPDTGGDTDLDHYSLIVDGEARLDGSDHVIISITSAIFHRPAPMADHSS